MAAVEGFTDLLAPLGPTAPLAKWSRTPCDGHLEERALCPSHFAPLNGRRGGDGGKEQSEGEPGWERRTAGITRSSRMRGEVNGRNRAVCVAIKERPQNTLTHAHAQTKDRGNETGSAVGPQPE